MPEDFSSSGSSPMKRYLQHDTRDSQHLQLTLRCRSLNFYVLINELLYMCTDRRMEMKIYGATVRFVSRRITVAELVMQGHNGVIKK